MGSGHAAVDISKDRLTLDEGVANLGARLQQVGVGALLVALLIGFFEQPTLYSFFRAYLANYCFVVSILLGALFFVMLQHLTRAGWSVVVRRVAEIVTTAFPLVAALSLPVVLPLVLGWPESILRVYPWRDGEYVKHEPVLQWKTAYLNPGFFLIRVALYFLIWIALSRYMLSRSLEQDRSGDPDLTRRMSTTAAPGMLLFALSLTFFAFDMLMSLSPSWYSTIYGVYYFAGSMLSFMATLAITLILVQRAGALTHAVTAEHYHDIGKLMFAFIVFWAYIAFSQYMLYWYANMPETSSWYVVRQQGPWLYLSLALLFGHFFIPFALLISRNAKRNRQMLLSGAILVLIVHWLDMLYLALPPYFFTFYKQAVPLYTGLSFVLAPLLLVGLGGIVAGSVMRKLPNYTLVPQRDPRLGESLAFQNI